MALVTFYFQLHQPCRLHPERTKLLWEEMNKEVFLKVSQKCYLPALSMFVDLVTRHPDFKITLSMSGTFLEQAIKYKKEVIAVLQKLYDAGKPNSQVEFLDETYYHSLASLFADPARQEFRDQVSMHRKLMEELFGLSPASFRNTELMYNNDIASIVADMGYKSILCEKRNDMFPPDKPISPNAVFRAKGTNLVVIPRNRELSDDIAFRFPHSPLSPKKYAEFISKVDGEAVLLGYDFEHIGEHIWEDKGIFEFWKHLPAELAKHQSVLMANPTEIASRFKDTDCPVADIHGLSTSSWADKARDTFGWLGSPTQQKLFSRVEDLESTVKDASAKFLTNWRYLTTSDHLYFIHEGSGEDHAVHSYFSPYNHSHSEAVRVLTDKIWELENSVKVFHILRNPETTVVIIISPETDRLPSYGMGEFAKYVAGKSGGMGEVVATLCRGLIERGISTHLITLNLKRKFRENAGISDSEWIRSRHKMDPQNVHLVTSSLFEDQNSAYDGNPLFTASEFQRQVVNTYIKEIQSKYQGHAIIHSHDWMAGGTIAAYAKLREIPLLHTVHNTHTGHIPLDMLFGINIDKIRDMLYFSTEYGRHCVDSQATAIKNANKISYVGRTFLKEVVEDYFIDRPIISWSVRQETKAKFYTDSAFVIPNGVSPDMYPEKQEENPDPDSPGLARKYSPDDDVISAKQANLAKFQKKMGLLVDPDAILLYWPSRLDPSQKGIELLESIAHQFVILHPDVQIAVVGNPVGNDRTHAEIMGRIAYSSGGKIAYRPFDDDLSILGYAAASDVFGASLYEPFGLIDVVGNLFGATATNRATGGYNDKIVPLNLKAWGAPQDSGNGVLFKNFDSTALWWALDKTVLNHIFFRRNPGQWLKQTKRIMKEARKNWSMENMIAGYIDAYNKLNQKPFF